MKPEEFVDKIRQALPTGLRSAILFGSAVAGDHLGEQSDYNLLLVLDKLDGPDLKALAVATQAWVKAGNHSPLLFTAASLRESADVFPIELLDIRDAHRTIFGEDVMQGLAVNAANLRQQIEYELRGKRLHLQSQFLLTGGQPVQVLGLLTGSLSKFLILFRATLRLYQEDAPAQKLEALHALTRHLAVEEAVFVTIHKLKAAGKKTQDVDADALYERYLRGIDFVTQAVNDFEKGTKK